MSFMPLLMMAAPLIQKMMSGGQEKNTQISTMSPEQQKLFQKINGMLSGGLGEGFEGSIDYQKQLMDPNSAAVQQFTEPMMQQFEQQIVPGLADRFAGQGAMGGGLSSSGFGQSLSSAGANLQNQLAQTKGQLGQQASGNLMNQYNQMSSQSLGAQPFALQQQGPDMLSQMMQGWAQGGFGGMQGGMDGFQDWLINNMPGGV